jgi:hypothetical protein
MSEDMTPLIPGRTYRLSESGNFVEADPPAPESATPVPDDDLPPDLRPGAKEAKPDTAKADAAKAVVENLKQVQEALKDTLGSAASPYQVQVTDEDRQNFLRAILSGDPYTKRFDLFGGSVKAHFKSLNMSELDAIAEAIVIQSGRVPYASMTAVAGAHLRFCMACSLAGLEFHSKDGVKMRNWEPVLSMYDLQRSRRDSYYIKEKDGTMQLREGVLPAVPGQKVLWAAVEKFSEISAPLYNMLFSLYQKFDSEMAKMQGEAASPDFFTNGGAGPSS